jgi:ribosomal protein L11 methyltransferase
MAVEYLDCVKLSVPGAVMEIFEAALSSVCLAVSFFHDEDNDQWDLQGVKERGADDDALRAALGVAEMITGFSPDAQTSLVPVAGWLARTKQAFPEQLIGRRFAVRGTHITAPQIHGRISLVLDAGLAFGTGEHNSTRGCLVALERVAQRYRPRRLLDLGTGSGLLAIAAAKLTSGTVLATDIDARATRVARANVQANGVARRVHAIQADGWANATIRRLAPYDLVFANILARPLCAMAHELATHLKPGGIAILAGLLTIQENWVLSAHRRAGLVLESRVIDGAWTTLVLKKPGRF